MQLVRAGGAYLTGRQHRLEARRRAIRLASIAAGVSAGVLWDPLGAVAAVLLAGVALRTHALRRRLARVGRGIEGEAVVTEVLGRLPEGYFLVNDVLLPGRRGNVDHVLIGPCGVIVIETKRYSGVIACRRERWFVNGRPIRSLTRQVADAAMSVKQFLTEACPALRLTALHRVERIIVFADPLCRLEVDPPRNTLVVRASELLGIVLEKGRQRVLQPAMAALLAQTLARGATEPERAASSTLTPRPVGSSSPAALSVG